MTPLLVLALLLGQDGIFERYHQLGLQQPLPDSDLSFTYYDYPARDFTHLVGLPQPDPWEQPREWVPAYSYQKPASHPCNLSSCGDGQACLAMCITGPTTEWGCSDPNAILLENGRDQHWCLKVGSEKGCATSEQGNHPSHN